MSRNRSVHAFTLCGLLLTVAATPRLAEGQIYSPVTLHSFTGGADGIPAYGVVLDAQGNLYGLATGGSDQSGIFYTVDTGGNYRVLYTFTGGADGLGPTSPLLPNGQGSFYGTTWKSNGGNGPGVIFKLDSAGNESTPYTFPGTPNVQYSVGGLVRDAQGNFYGVSGWVVDGEYGSVFKVDPSGNLTILHTFTNGADGGYVQPGLSGDAQGNLYGTAFSGGANGAGVVFKVDAGGNFSVLHDFEPGKYSYVGPNGGLLIDAQGNLYGTTDIGGAAGLGTLYKIDAAGNYSVLDTFNGGNGSSPVWGVVEDAQGNLYGMTEGGGVYGYGTVYKFDPMGHETLLYSFTGLSDGLSPFPQNVAIDPQGNFYVTTSEGGSGNSGVLSKLVLPVPSSVAFNPNSLRGKKTTKLTLTLNVGAPPNLAGGLIVTLTSSDPKIVPVPATVLIKTKQSVLDLNVQTLRPHKKKHVIVTASANGVTVSTTLIVKP